MRHTDVTDIAARTRGVDRLHHRLLRADALQYRIGTDSLGQFLDARNTFIAALSHNVSSTKFACELLARCVTAHRNDSVRTHLFRGEHAEQSDCAITDDCNGRTWFHVCCISGEPPGTHDIGQR